MLHSCARRLDTLGNYANTRHTTATSALKARRTGRETFIPCVRKLMNAITLQSTV